MDWPLYICIIKTGQNMTQTKAPSVFLSIEQFDMDLEDCLTIIQEPTRSNHYYVCEYVSPALYKSIIHIYLTK